MRPGVLSLIGCGPGAADLLTLRAADRIGRADLVLYDRLVSADIVAMAAADAEVVNVGKVLGACGRPQHDINQRLEAELRAGRRVARLKSGDPMVFGRAAEEIAVAASIDAEVEIVPGVTAALAAAAETGLTPTERDELHSFVITTGRAADADQPPDWASFARPGVCSVFYMGVAQAARIQQTLMAYGVPAAAPASWVERASSPSSRRVDTTLGRLVDTTLREGVTNPAVLFVRFPYSLAAAETPRLAAE